MFCTVSRPIDKDYPLMEQVTADLEVEIMCGQKIRKGDKIFKICNIRIFLWFTRFSQASDKRRGKNFVILK